MRYRIIVASLLTFIALNASAQTVDKRPSMEPVGSPFTYEALGATPSLNLRMRGTTSAATPADDIATARSKKTSESKAPTRESEAVEPRPHKKPSSRETSTVR